VEVADEDAEARGCLCGSHRAQSIPAPENCGPAKLGLDGNVEGEIGQIERTPRRASPESGRSERREQEFENQRCQGPKTP
jgi:hypothetical protein